MLMVGSMREWDIDRSATPEELRQDQGLRCEVIADLSPRPDDPAFPLAGAGGADRIGTLVLGKPTGHSSVSPGP